MSEVCKEEIVIENLFNFFQKKCDKNPVPFLLFGVLTVVIEYVGFCRIAEHFLRK